VPPAAENKGQVGASFTAVTATCTWIALAEASAPSHALIVNAFTVPFAFAAGVHTNDSLVPSSVVPATTAAPPLVSVPVLTASTRKLNAVPSTSASFAAAASAA
jgi:hypothetical protein